MDTQKSIVVLRRKQVESITGLSRSSIYSKMEIGTFPKPIKLSERSVGWLDSEVQDWLKSRVAETRKEESHARCQN